MFSKQKKVVKLIRNESRTRVQRLIRDDHGQIDRLSFPSPVLSPADARGSLFVHVLLIHFNIIVLIQHDE